MNRFIFSTLAAVGKTNDFIYRENISIRLRVCLSNENARIDLKDNKIFLSMSQKRNCFDNSLIENFFGLLKQEKYYGEIYENFGDLKVAIEEYIHYYNHFRKN